ncbi:MAG: phospholipase [Dysgonomonas sp.]|nr:phospholipase [Dysgonomonas sp.]
MELFFIFLGIILFFVVSLFIWNNYQRKIGNTEREEAIQADPVDGTCCGQHNTCEKDSLINSFVEEPDYFDDEELDKYKGRDAENYSHDEVDEFREVFYTMDDEDKPRWIRSLLQRQIDVPNQIKDEIFMIINELRATRVSHS